jgi:hypothetical protein
MRSLFVGGSGLKATMQRGRGCAGGGEAEMLFWGRAIGPDNPDKREEISDRVETMTILV